MSKQATRDAYGEVLVELGAASPDIVVLDADLSKSTRTAKFQKEYPERFFNIGIAESNLAGTAAGLAAAGKIPFMSSFAVFASGRAFEQIRNSICYPALNVKIAASHAGVTVGPDGGSHQSIEDIALMRVLPNMTVVVPADGVSAKALIRDAAKFDGPVYIRLGRSKTEIIYDEDQFITIGQANEVRQGDDLTIIACGIMVEQALMAADSLAEAGVKARVLDMATIKPLDVGAVLKAAQETGAVVTAEEHSVIGGLGSAVASFLGEHCPVPVQMVGVRDRFGQSGGAAELMKEYGLTAEDIHRAAEAVLKRK